MSAHLSAHASLTLLQVKTWEKVLSGCQHSCFDNSPVTKWERGRAISHSLGSVSIDFYNLNSALTIQWLQRWGFWEQRHTGSLTFFPLYCSSAGVFPNPQQAPLCRKLGEKRGCKENSRLALLRGAGRALPKKSSEVLWLEKSVQCLLEGVTSERLHLGLRRCLSFYRGCFCIICFLFLPHLFPPPLCIHSPQQAIPWCTIVFNC